MLKFYEIEGRFPAYREEGSQGTPETGNRVILGSSQGKTKSHNERILKP
jgi:hypothetical protein